MGICLFLTGLGAAALLFYIREKIQRYSLKGVFLKTVVSVLFISVAVAAGSSAKMAPFITLGLVSGLLGDIWLDLKYVYPSDDDEFTYAGFIAFGIGHIFYLSGLLYQFGAGLYLLPSFALAAAADVLIAVLEKPMKLSYGKMKPVVLIYGILLFSTVFVSGGLWLTKGSPALRLIFIGSALFAISDLILSGIYFGEGKNRPADIIGNYLTYYAGQFLIALALVFV